MRLRETLYGKLLLLVCSLALTLGFFEGGARLLGYEPEPPTVTDMFAWSKTGEFWVLPPGRDRLTNIGNYMVRVNDYGVRGTQIGDKTPGRPRILFLGDSVTFGYALPEEKIFAYLLNESELPGTGSIEVINAAVAGWSARQYRMFLERHAEDLQPDIVLVGIVLNDLTELLNGVRESASGTSIAAMNMLSALAQKWAAVAALKHAYVVLADPREREIESVREFAERPDSRAVREAMRLHLEELTLTHEFASERGIPLGLVLFPFMFQLRNPDMDNPQQQMRQFGAERDIPVLDTIEALRTQPAGKVMLDYLHLSPTGHQIVADAVLDWLPESGLLADAASD